MTEPQPAPELISRENSPGVYGWYDILQDQLIRQSLELEADLLDGLDKHDEAAKVRARVVRGEVDRG